MLLLPLSKFFLLQVFFCQSFPKHKFFTMVLFCFSRYHPKFLIDFSSVQSLGRVWLWDPMDCSMPGLSVHYQLPEFTQTHVHRVGDAIQPSHPLSSPSPPTFNLSQHQGLFQRVSSLHQVAKILKLQLQHQSFQWTPRTDLLQDGLVGSPCSPRDSQESSPTPEFNSQINNTD